MTAAVKEELFEFVFEGEMWVKQTYVGRVRAVSESAALAWARDEFNRRFPSGESDRFLHSLKVIDPV